MSDEQIPPSPEAEQAHTVDPELFAVQGIPTPTPPVPIRSISSVVRSALSPADDPYQEAQRLEAITAIQEELTQKAVLHQLASMDAQAFFGGRRDVPSEPFLATLVDDEPLTPIIRKYHAAQLADRLDPQGSLATYSTAPPNETTEQQLARLQEAFHEGEAVADNVPENRVEKVADGLETLSQNEASFAQRHFESNQGFTWNADKNTLEGRARTEGVRAGLERRIAASEEESVETPLAPMASSSPSGETPEEQAARLNAAYTAGQQLYLRGSAAANIPDAEASLEANTGVMAYRQGIRDAANGDSGIAPGHTEVEHGDNITSSVTYVAPDASNTETIEDVVARLSAAQDAARQLYFDDPTAATLTEPDYATASATDFAQQAAIQEAIRTGAVAPLDVNMASTAPEDETTREQLIRLRAAHAAGHQLQENGSAADSIPTIEETSYSSNMGVLAYREGIRAAERGDDPIPEAPVLRLDLPLHSESTSFAPGGESVDDQIARLQAARERGLVAVRDYAAQNGTDGLQARANLADDSHRADRFLTPDTHPDGEPNWTWKNNSLESAAFRQGTYDQAVYERGGTVELPVLQSIHPQPEAEVASEITMDTPSN